jgi:hypothetical protein
MSLQNDLMFFVMDGVENNDICVQHGFAII